MTGVSCVLGTGGIFAYGWGPQLVLEAAKYDEKNPFSLRPKRPELFIDKDYILYAIGLLGEIAPGKALRIAKTINFYFISF